MECEGIAQNEYTEKCCSVCVIDLNSKIKFNYYRKTSIVFYY